MFPTLQGAVAQLGTLLALAIGFGWNRVSARRSAAT
jgi:hypothetical protein